ncbi:4Fe-4S dicluster domain-containing protein [Dysgonomonas sp. 25]|uniref:4Fe-4S binding protein n=1 Tax=Dysgonomonas sp. 25 TaxID=2302933 RepID=UPI0013D347A0|nr:4Fe-4S dicluster domain-containing protein [Dysgonomonas sp. 25]NDV70209.1 4Fe-4S dicluster domain-containing protein [Dysgonomonas sp. 25]
MTVSQYFSGLFGGIKSLLVGMSVTMKELFTKKVTQQYPENRKTLVIPERVRGVLTMPHDENNEHACTACGICQMNCPNGTITVESEMVTTEEGKKKRVLTTYTYRLGQCTFCNLCVLTCPSDAIVFSNEFESAVFNKARLTEKLNHEGSKLREKKVAPKPAPAPAPVAETEVKKEEQAPAAENNAASTETDKE